MGDVKLTLISPEGRVRIALNARTRHPVDLVHACMERAGLTLTATAVEGSYLAVAAVIAYLADTRTTGGVSDIDTAISYLQLNGWDRESVDLAYDLVPRILAWVGASKPVSG